MSDVSTCAVHPAKRCFSVSPNSAKNAASSSSLPWSPRLLRSPRTDEALAVRRVRDHDAGVGVRLHLARVDLLRRDRRREVGRDAGAFEVRARQRHRVARHVARADQRHGRAARVVGRGVAAARSACHAAASKFFSRSKPNDRDRARRDPERRLRGLDDESCRCRTSGRGGRCRASIRPTAGCRPRGSRAAAPRRSRDASRA